MTMLEFINNYIAVPLSIISAIGSFVFFLRNKSIRKDILENVKIGVYSDFIGQSEPIVKKIRAFILNARTQEASNLALKNLNFCKDLTTYHSLIKTIESQIEKDDKRICLRIKQLERDIDYYLSIGDISSKDGKELHNTYLNVIEIQCVVRENKDKITF